MVSAFDFLKLRLLSLNGSNILSRGVSNPYSETSVYLQRLKRTATILFTMLYLLSSSGILVGQHLCMDRVKETSLFKKVESKCGMDMHMHADMEDCCDDKWALKIIEDDQQISVSSDVPSAVYHLLFEIPFVDFEALVLAQQDKVEVNNTGPPDIPKPDLTILYHSLKIPAALQS